MNAIEIYLKVGAKLRLATPEHCAAARTAYNRGRGASAIRKDLSLYDKSGAVVGHVSYNGRAWLHTSEGTVPAYPSTSDAQSPSA